MLYAIIGMLVIIADQYIKFWVQGHIALGASEEFIPGILSLANVHNDGAAFGFLAGDGARIPFIILAGVFTVAVIIALATRLISGRLSRWSIVLVTAGALSNCLDRVMYGYVQDMFKTEFMNFPVFNLADVFITIFAIVFALAKKSPLCVPASLLRLPSPQSVQDAQLWSKRTRKKRRSMKNPLPLLSASL